MKNEELTREQLIEFAMKRVEAKLAHYRKVGRVRECDADDLRQDVLVTVLEKMADFDNERKTCERTFINSLVKNAFRYHFSNARLVKNQTFSDIDALSEVEEPTTNDVSGGEMSELDRIYLKLDMETLRDKLSEKQREVFDLLGTHSLTEIAGILNLSVRTVGNRIEEIRESAKDCGFGE